MTDEVFFWHPKYNVYILENNDIVLISELEYLIFPADKYPLLCEINGKNSVDKIIARNDEPQTGALFLFHSKKMLQENVLLRNKSSAIEYRKGFCSTIEIHSENQFCSIYNNSISNSAFIATWVSIISGAIELQIKQESQQSEGRIKVDKNRTIILVDDFINPNLADLPPNFDDCMLIKISGNQIWVSPFLTRGQFAFLQHQLIENKPVRKTLIKLLPDSDHSIPFAQKENLSEPDVEKIIGIIVNQMSLHKWEICIYDPNKGFPEFHPINPYKDYSLSFSKQLGAPIKLDKCLSLFDKDGGSRHVDPQQTVDKLMKLVSPVTGVITHIQELQRSEEASIRIYQTAFFKTPKRDIEFSHESFISSCMGKGVSSIQSQASALCETIERHNAQYKGEELLLLSKHSDLDNKSYQFQQLVPYSENQYQKFMDPSHPDSRLKQAAQPYQDEAIHWISSWSLTHEHQVYVPLTSCFANSPFEEEKFGRWHSNGCAAGNTLEEAILQGLFELIERDATAIWWYNQVERPPFDIARIDPDNLELLRQTIGNTHDFWVLDLTVDIGIPVMAAIGKDRSSGGYCFGFGCHLRAEMAAQRALTELCQLLPIRDQNSAPFDFDAIEKGPHLYPSANAKPTNGFIPQGDDIKQDILDIVARLNNLGYETLALNYSRAYIPLNTVKVFVPGLCHIWPQLANERLYRVPFEQGWLAHEKTEATINRQPLYI